MGAAVKMWRSVMHLRRAAIPAALAICPPLAAETLIIGNKGEDTVSFVDLETGQERARTATARAPHEVAVSPNGKQAAVVAYGGTTLDIFDVRKASLVKRIDLAPNAAPHGIVWLKNGLLVVAAEKSKSVVLVNPRRGSFRAIPTDQAGSHMLVVSPDQKTAYVANILAGTVSVIDLIRKSKIADISVGGNPEGLAITPDGRHLWVGDDSTPRVRVVDLATRQTVETVPTDSIAIRIAISPDGRSVITSNMASGTLNIFDAATRKPVRSIRVSGERSAMQVTLSFALDGKRLYVAETGHNAVAEVEVSTGMVLRRIPAGRNGDGLGIAP